MEFCSDMQTVPSIKNAPGLGQTEYGRPGEKTKGPDDPSLQPGTALATFNKDGEYVSQDTGGHAVIFLEYTVQGGEPGMKVLEQ